MFLDFYRNKKVLVTGGAGFIGSHLCDMLVAQGAHVTVLDNLSTGSRENLAHHQEKITFISGSIEDFSTCLKATAGQEIVFHLAAQVSVAESQQAPHPALHTNTSGTLNVLEAARTQRVKRILFASSAAVYGTHEGVCRENDPLSPVSTYGYSKLMGEQLCQLYARIYDLQTVCLRFFNVFGPRQNPASGNGGVLAVFRHKLAHNEPLTLYGDGLQTRDFIPVEKVVTALLQAGMLPDTYADGQAFNIATGTSVTLKSKLEELLPYYPAYEHPITYLPARTGDIRHSAADCSKFQKAVL